MNNQLLTHPAYDRWRPFEATDNFGDGKADARIVPLVEHLRRKGVVTTFSCSGHAAIECVNPMCAIGFDHPGYLSVLDETVSAESIVEVRGRPFWGVEMHIWPDPLTIVFRWEWRDAREAIARLYGLEPRRD